jgi:MFS family permease
VVFFSTDLFKGNGVGIEGEKSARLGTIIFGTVNMVSALSSTILLNKFGRKSLMIVGQFAMAISLGLFALFNYIEGIDNIYQIIMVLIFTAFFEWSIGPILWLYLAEILPTAGLSIAVFLNWAVVVAIGFLTPVMVSYSKVMTFSIYSICCLVGGLFIIAFIKETKGLSKE